MVVPESSSFLVPTASMPMPPEVSSVLRHDDEVANTHIDHGGAARTDVRLARLIRLNRMHVMFVERTKTR